MRGSKPPDHRPVVAADLLCASTCQPACQRANVTALLCLFYLIPSSIPFIPVAFFFVFVFFFSLPPLPFSALSFWFILLVRKFHELTNDVLSLFFRFVRSFAVLFHNFIYPAQPERTQKEPTTGSRMVFGGRGVYATA